MKISEQLQQVLTRAGLLAVRYRNQYVTPEHLLFAIAESEDGNAIISKCGVVPQLLLDELDDYLSTDCPIAEGGASPQYSLGLQEIIAVSANHTISSEKSELNVSSVFAALFRLKDSDAVYILNEHGITRLDVIRIISHGSSDEESPLMDTAPSSGAADTPNAHLENLCIKAKNGLIDPLIGRTDELEQLIQVLARRRKNNPIFVGEPGVGKTAIVEGLASAVVNGTVPESLKTLEVFSLDMGSMLAGTRYRGDFEERIKKILTELKSHPNSALFIDEIHLLVGAGAVSGGGVDAANLLKPILSTGELRCIGATTTKEYRQIFEKDGALARRFQKIDVAAPSVEDAIAILDGLQSKFATFHGVTYDEDAVHACVTLTHQFIDDRALPDKAVDALDQAGAVAKLANRPLVTLADVENVVSKMAKIPAKTLQGDQKEKISQLETELKSAIIGQDAAIAQCCTAILIAKAGLGNPERPIGAFLMVGPTGVGKTELAKQIAHHLGITLCRFDMSEYMEKHTVARLIGSPPGYVGHEEGGQLTEAIRQTPNAVVLLDEIEKAHPDIMNILLQVMDYGALTDSLGRKVNFRQTIILMTSNTGAWDRNRTPIGFEQSPHATSKAAIEKDFSPEFRNRLTAILEFNPLSPATIDLITERQLIEVKDRLFAQKITLKWSAAVVKYLSETGFDPVQGARPIARHIETTIVQPISRAIIESKISEDSTVDVGYQKNKLKFLFS